MAENKTANLKARRGDLISAWVAFVCAFGVIAIGCAFAARGQEPQNPIQWSASAGNSGVPIKPGQPLNATVTATIASGWHLYSMDQPQGGPTPTRVTLPEGQPFRLAGDVKEPAPTVKFDPNFNLQTRFFENSVTFIVPLKVASGTPAGVSEVKFDVRYQACNDRLCMPPRTAHLSAALAVGKAGLKGNKQAIEAPHGGVNSGATTADTATTSAPGTAEANSSPGGTANQAGPTPIATFGSVAAASRGNIWSFVWLAMGMGALSLLTPCVFPMIPITVSYFTNHTAQSRIHAVRNAILYVLGIILTFTALGLGLAFVFGAGGVNQLAANPWVNLLITVIFVGFALSLFGVFFLQVPAGLVTKLDSITRSPGTSEVIGVLLMGLTFTLTSFTCTSPFVGTVLVMAAQGSWKWPLAGMLAFSSVFALPFFALAIAPQFAARLPKSGSWLNSVKVVMGFLELAAAMKFLSNTDLIWHWGIFTRETVLGIWIVIAIMAAIFVVGRLPIGHAAESKRITPVRALIAAAFLLVAVWLGLGFLGRPLGEIESFLPPMTHGGAMWSAFASEGHDGARLSWISNDYSKVLEQARLEQKPIFINFTGYTCTNCRWMEANMFTRPEVRRELAHFVLAELYTDGSGKVYEDQQDFQQQRYGTVALPYYVIANANGETVATYAGLTRDPAEFLAFLDRGVSSSPNK
jgi:thiol:disulfide interchange protein